jgi:hypothetical protein
MIGPSQQFEMQFETKQEEPTSLTETKKKKEGTNCSKMSFFLNGSILNDSFEADMNLC